MSSLKRRDDRDGPDAAELAMIALSVLTTVALFAYVAVQAATGPSGPALAAETERIEPRGDELHVQVVVRNDGGTGVRSVTVEVPCDDPPPSQSFQFVPAGGHRRGVFVCPAGADDVQPSISAWASV